VIKKIHRIFVKQTDKNITMSNINKHKHFSKFHFWFSTKSSGNTIVLRTNDGLDG
jgi:hypothetical protein